MKKVRFTEEQMVGILREADRSSVAEVAKKHKVQPGMDLRLRSRRLRQGPEAQCLTVIDEFTRECLAIDVAGNIRSARVIEVLTRLISTRGAPAFLRSDNGPDFVSKAILEWLTNVQIDTALIDPGKPWQNGADESFNGKLRDECLSMEWFRTRIEARVLIEIWRRHYKDVRPHSSLDYRTPQEFREHHESIPDGAILK